MARVQTLSVITETFEEFLDENGLWFDWKKFLSNRGWTLEELGMKDNDNLDIYEE